MTSSSRKKRLHDRLLRQARDLATKDKKRPQQANLRRAVSTSYYALFHLLIYEATRSLSRGNARAKLRLVLARAFAHDEMASACRSFGSGGALPDLIQTIYPGVAVPPDLRNVAKAFLDLQKSRHDADYAAHIHWTRTEVITKVERAERAFETWERISMHELAPLFLASLLTWKRITAR